LINEIISFVLIGFLIITAFVNQIILKSKIIVNEVNVNFQYRTVFGFQNRTVDLLNYDSIWVQKMKKRIPVESAEGTSYIKVRLKHSWTRFRNIQLYGPIDESKIQFYSNLFKLPIKTSFISIMGKYV